LRRILLIYLAFQLIYLLLGSCSSMYSNSYNYGYTDDQASSYSQTYNGTGFGGAGA
jgi:hypothetical protein